MPKRTMLFPVAALAVMLIAAAPALAQTAGGPSAGSPTYALQGDQLIVDGDQAFDCPSLTSAVEQYGSGQASGDSVATPQSEQVARYAQLCYQYGFSASVGETPSVAAESQPTAALQSAPEAESAPAQGPTAAPAQGPSVQALPATGGGVPLLLVVALVAGSIALGVISNVALRAGRR